MQKLLPLIFIALLCVAPSCKKNWICACRYHHYTITSIDTIGTANYAVQSATRKEATDKCSVIETSGNFTVNGYTNITNCSLQ